MQKFAFQIAAKQVTTRVIERRKFNKFYNYNEHKEQFTANPNLYLALNAIHSEVKLKQGKGNIY